MAASKKHLFAASAATALITLVGLASPSYAEPAVTPAAETTQSVQQQIQQKQEELASVTEQYLDAKIELDKQNAAQAQADEQLQTAQAGLEAAKKSVAESGAEQYKAGALPASMMLLVGESPADFIDKANAQQIVASYHGEKITALTNAETATATAKQQADAAKAAAQSTIDTLTEKKTYIESQIPELEAKLATLTASERQSLDASQGGTTQAARDAAANPQAALQAENSATAAPASGSAATVVNWAMSQRGKPYVWGGAGPNGYDCSGLTMAAYAQIGISLPHSSSGQQAYGKTVSLSALQPGDLVFASGHVAIYIGNGTVVHAPTFGSPVRTMPMSYMDFYTARRLV